MLNHQVRKRFFHCYVNISSEDDQIKCHKCDAVYKSNTELSRHVQNVHHLISYDCDLSDEVFKREDNQSRHEKDVHGGVRLTCTTCGKQFSRTDALKRHKLVHETAAKIECENCDSTFNLKVVVWISRCVIFS